MITYAYAALVLVAVLIGQVIGIHGLYYLWPPYDVLMHIAGGIGIGLFMLAIIRLHTPQSRHRALLIIAGALAFGIVWELFEIRFNLSGYTFGSKLYFIDTAKDLVDDLVGGALVAVFS